MLGFSERENEVAKLVSEELTNKQIAQRLGFCERSVRYYIHSACRKVNAQTRVGLAVAYATKKKGVQYHEKNKMFLIFSICIFMSLLTTVASANDFEPLVPEPDQSADAHLNRNSISPIDKNLSQANLIVFSMTASPTQNVANFRQALSEKGLNPDSDEFADAIEKLASSKSQGVGGEILKSKKGVGLAPAAIDGDNVTPNSIGFNSSGVFVPPCPAGRVSGVFGHMLPGWAHVSVHGSFPGTVMGHLVQCLDVWGCG